MRAYNVSKPDEKPHRRPHVAAEPDGSFSFSSYGIGDGVPPATYVVVFAVLTDKKKHGYVGPDELKNLYNDPEKNEKIPEFKIDHKAPERPTTTSISRWRATKTRRLDRRL